MFEQDDRLRMRTALVEVKRAVEAGQRHVCILTEDALAAQFDGDYNAAYALMRRLDFFPKVQDWLGCLMEQELGYRYVHSGVSVEDCIKKGDDKLVVMGVRLNLITYLWSVYA